ncbi:GNAT family N-acetyltransferase [Actinoplanes teichomyceticus]|uniref:GNAT family N-acetyltransferase n=1 Tax=Actinoplanes teichomyceticus TaxID=1867 RepID=UPI001EF2E47F|nr:GNAT family N-acetyltransferase [Actinoplanes teichomyceticus]
MTTSPFTPDDAAENELADYYQLALADARTERPDDPEPTYEAAIGRLRTPLTALGRCVHRAAYADGRLVGLISAGLPEDENVEQAVVDVKVHPDHRRRGIGTTLLRTLLPTLASERRTLLAGWGLIEGKSGASWAKRRGFRVVYRQVLQGLDVVATDRELWRVAAPEGYRTVQWVGTAPAELLASYAEARSAIHDMPSADWSYRPPTWTPERIRRAEAELRERNVEQRVVAAVHEETGTAVGLTELEFYPHRPDFGYQQETAVLAGHRGRGLGRLMKARMMDWVVQERPGTTHVWTTTADDNVHMRRVNEQIGYATIRVMVNVEVETDAVQL